MSRPSSTDAGDLARALKALPRATRADLIALWRRAYGAAPPKGLSRRLLEHAAAHHLQTKAHGGLDAASRRSLATLIRRAEMPAKAGTRTAMRRVPPRLCAGIRLIRAWNGNTHVVEVVERGYLWNGTHWRSLSAIAKAITGAHWSGPRFFGLAGESAAAALSRPSRSSGGRGR